MVNPLLIISIILAPASKKPAAVFDLSKNSGGVCRIKAPQAEGAE